MARMRTSGQASKPMTAKERRRLIKAPISINTVGSAGKSHGGCDIRSNRRPELTDDGYMESRITPQDIAIYLQQRATSRRKGRL